MQAQNALHTVLAIYC